MNKPVKPSTFEPTPNNLEPFWMGFTPNRAFKQRPRMIARAKDMHYYDRRAGPSSTAVPDFGARTPAIAAIPLSTPSSSRQPNSISRQPSSTATPRFSNWPRASPRWRRMT
jgi:hypothetical protein